MHSEDGHRKTSNSGGLQVSCQSSVLSPLSKIDLLGDCIAEAEFEAISEHYNASITL